MDESAKRQTIESARSLEKKGELESAARAFLRAGAYDDAARVLISVGRFQDAGQLLLKVLGVPPSKVGGLDATARKLAQKAAICFSKAGDVDVAVELFLALGDKPRAVEVLERAGDHLRAAKLSAQAREMKPVILDVNRSAGAVGKAEVITRAGAQRLEAAGQHEEAMRAYIGLKLLGDAGRMARQLGMIADAGTLFADGGVPFEAARCFLELGDTGKALTCLVRVPRDAPEYRAACVTAIKIAVSLKSLDFELDQFVTRFVGTGPRTEKELEAFYLLAKLYQAHDFVENARDTLAKILDANPRYRDVAEKIAAIDAETRGSAMVYEKIVREDAAFRGEEVPGQLGRASTMFAPTTPKLPEMPDLPPLPGSTPRAQPVDPAREPVRDAPPSSRHGAGLAGPARHTPPSVRGAETLDARQVPAAGRDRSAPTMAQTMEAPVPTPVVATRERDEVMAGDVIADRYRVEQKIGQGGMAAVFKATDLELGELIAIKLFAAGPEDPQMVSRFKQELTLSRQLVHPNLVRLYDIGTHRARKFITMELLTGTDLRGRMRGPMELGRAIHYLGQACAGLHVAHERGVVHRDIKPENFFVTTDDVLKVMDFGIAKGRPSAGHQTVAGFVAGTPAYMSPEQINSFGTVTHLSDLYALGVVAYELVTGTVPFDHDEIGPLLMMHLTETPTAPRERNHALPEELDYLILQLLEKDPARRVQSCLDLGRDLAEIARLLQRPRRR